MEQSEDTSLGSNVTPQKNDENFTLEEWTIIEDDDNAQKLLKAGTDISSPETESSENENTSDAEEAQELTKLNLKEPVTNPEKEESDGVSVISESENEERTEDDKRRIILYRSVSQGTEELELQNSNNEVTWCICLLVACSVLTAIGISLGSYARNSLPKDIDYVSLKMENDRLVDRMKELTNVKSLLEEIKSGLIIERSPDDAETSTGEEAKPSPEVLSHGAKIGGEEETNVQENLFPERLQVFLHTLCLMLDDIDNTREITVSRRSVCDTRTFFSDVAHLRKLLDRAIGQMDETTALANRRFLKDIDFRIASMCDSLMIDLSRALEKLSSKSEKKKEKIVEKMTEKLCVLRNTMPSDSKVRHSFETNDDFVQNCDKFDGRRRDRRSSETHTEPSPAPKTSFQKTGSKCSPSNNLRPHPNEKNSTKSQNASNEYRRKTWKGKKKNAENSGAFKPTSRETEDDTCSVSPTPPSRRSSTWKWSKQQKSLHPPLIPKEDEKEVKIRDDSQDKENSARYNEPSVRTEENVDGTLSARKTRKKNTERDGTKNRKSSLSTDEKENVNAKRKIKPRTKEVRSYSSDVVDDLENPMETTIRHRTKKRFEEAQKKRFTTKKEKEDIGTNGQWQFARSQIRDELRKAESHENWYFDRMRNRRSSRMNIDDSKEHR